MERLVQIGQAVRTGTHGQRLIAAQVGAPRFGTGGILDAGVREQQEMMAAAKNMDFLLAAKLRDEMFALEKMMEEKFS